jgi:putative ABC transport system permease protein
MLGMLRLERLLGDVRYALRTLRSNLGFTCVAVLTLALGIGANTAIFTLIDSLLLRSLPVPQPQELVRIRSVGGRGQSDNFSYAIVDAFSERKNIFSGVAGFNRTTFNVGQPGSLTRVNGAWVTGEYYTTLAIRPALGRLLGPADDTVGAPPAAVLSYSYWQRQYAGDAAIIGQTLPIGGVAVTIVGVSPRGFSGTTVERPAEITIAVAALPQIEPVNALLLSPGNFWLIVLARPSPGLSTEAAAARLAVEWPEIADQNLSREWPPAIRQETIDLKLELVPGATGHSALRAPFQQPLVVLMGIVALVLLIACANVANLLLARGAARERELGVRVAVGAGGGHIVRQLLTESALLSVVGAALGIWLAFVASRFLVDVFVVGVGPVVLDVTPSLHVLGFTAAVAVATTLLFGLAPALRAARTAPVRALRGDSGPARAAPRLAGVLAAAQIALSLLLLVGAGLFVQTLENLRAVDAGFLDEGVLVADVDARRERLSGPALLAFYETLLERVRALPGVASASLSSNVPLSGSSSSNAIVPLGQALPERDNAQVIDVMPGFFDTLGTRILSGRDVNAADVGSSRVALINAAYAARYFAGRNPLGERLTNNAQGASPIEIVGVVEDAVANSLRAPPRPTVYYSYAQHAASGEFIFNTTLSVRVSGSFATAAGALRAELARQFPSATVEVRALTEQVDRALQRERLMATLAGGFGVLGLLLACIGIYGLFSYNVARRTREFGIRIALGARQGGVVRLAVAGAIKLLVAGLVVGVPAALAASRWVESMLFGLQPMVPVVVVSAAVLLACAALAAAYLPARRAARVDPVVALRLE